MNTSLGSSADRFCTIIASNYLPQARVLAASIAEHHPDSSPLLVLCVDEPATSGDSEVNLEIIRPEQLDLPERVFWRMATLYDTTELCTALKPWLLDFLLGQGAGVAVYLDPDMLLLQPLEEMLDEARGSVALLTPHRLTPLGDDNLQPSEQSLLLSGFFNLGFIAVTPRGLPFLAWWKERLESKSLIDHGSGYFTDQRWIDQAVHLFDLSATRDPRLNVAYWNFDERLDQVRLLGTEDAARPSLMHFSGYSPAIPWLVSRHVADRPRVELSSESTLLKALDHYADLLVAAGWTEGKSESFWPVLADGSRRGVEFRAAYRSALRLSGIRAANPPPPALGTHFAEFVHWATSRDDRHELPRWVDAVWHARADLQAFAPDPEFSHKRHLMDWAITQGVTENWVPQAIAERLTAPRARSGTVEAAESPAHFPARLEPAIRLVGYLDSVLGIGELGRSIARGLTAAGMEYEAETWTASRSPRYMVDEYVSAKTSADIEIVVINADQMERWASTADRPAVGTYRIGVWAWELPDFPPEMAMAEKWVDEIWTISEFSAAAIRSAVSKSVHVVPLNLDDSLVASKDSVADDSERHLPERTFPSNGYFAFAFDLHSDIRRKNPVGLMQAYRAAFPTQGSAPQLIIKALNSGTSPLAAQELRYHAHKWDVTLVEEVWSRPVVREFMRRCIAYISLHRSEGFGLTLAEAMSLGRPAIATGYSGNCDFMTGSNSVLLPYTLAPVGKGSIYSPGSRWADPDLEAASAAFSAAATGGQSWDARARKGQLDVWAKCSPEETAAFIKSRLGPLVVGIVERHGMESRDRVSSPHRAHAKGRLARKFISSLSPSGGGT